MHIYICKYTRRMYASMYVYTCIYVYNIYIYTYIHVCTYMYESMNVHIYVYMYVCMYAFFMYVCKYVCMYYMFIYVSVYVTSANHSFCMLSQLSSMLWSAPRLIMAMRYTWIFLLSMYLSFKPFVMLMPASSEASQSSNF